VLFGAVLMALSLAGSAGPVGRALDWALRGSFGGVSYFVPLATLLVSLAAFVRREEAGRIFVGTLLITAGLTGMVHLLSGAGPLTGGYEGLAVGGGVLGALLATPLRTYVGAWAGVLACLFFGVLGVLITTKTPLRRAAEAAWHGGGVGLRWTLRRLVASVRFAVAEISKRRQKPPVAPVLRAVPDLSEDLGEEAPEAEMAPLVPAMVEDLPVAGVPIPIHDPGTVTQPTLDLPMPKRGAYKLPPVDKLRRSNGSARTGVRGADEVSAILERTLDDFGVDARVTAHTRGPTVTRFEIELGAGVKVQRVLSLNDDIAYALGSPEVRIIAPIPGKSAIGIEVPNRDRELVTVGDIVTSQVWKRSTHPLTCALGKDIAGHPVVVNLAEMPHLLIAGSTGAGKSSCLNTLIGSLLMKAKPDEVRLILIDPKMVELSNFDSLPHLLSPVVTHPKRAAETLNWVVKEMERRYQELALVGQRNLDLYNAAVRAGTLPASTQDGKPREVLPYIAVFIDELADLMMVAARQVEDSICRIAQMARAVGIHLVVATQRPSVDVVTGLIKANIPSRIAFAVASQSDSRVILDMGGADKLVGHGDMLYLPTGTSKPRRIQGAYVTETELADLTAFIRAQAEAEYSEEVLEAATREIEDGDDGDDDPLLSDAMELVIRTGLGSTSMLQRRLKVGFSRAGRIMDILERKGVVGPPEGSKARSVLITVEQFEEMRVRERLGS
jgi:S-DNA-T family DNA segregation ATPase FtsK/SpoIIIE